MSGARSSEKWIQGLNPSMPVDEAARHVLGLRLQSVADAVKKARKRDQLEAPLVHQLRVATRRADAAMQAFESLMDAALAKRMSKKLKKIRRAAADVRMCDVHLGELRRRRELRGDPLQRAAFEHALLRASSERQQSARHLERVAERWGGKSWRRAIGDLVDAVSSAAESHEASDTRTLKSFADEGLAGLAGQFIAAAQNDLTSAEKLHELRIDGKHVRYALEIFAECMDDDEFTNELYGSLAALQERLGAINDSHEIAVRLARYSQELEAALQQEGASTEPGCATSALCAQLDMLAVELRDQSQSAHQQFLEWWKDDQKQQFIDALHRLTVQPTKHSQLNDESSAHGADLAVDVERHSIQGFIGDPQAQHS